MDQQETVSAGLAGSLLVRRTARQDCQQGDQKMANISSFKMAAGALGIAALASIPTAAPMAAGNAAGQSALQVPQSVGYGTSRSSRI